MAQRDAKRKESVSYLELIELKPPIDLIPDEFERKSNENILIELVCAAMDLEAKNLKRLLSDMGYIVNTTDKEKLEAKPDEKWINNVQQKLKKRNCDGMIMIFAKVFYTNRDMKHVWSKFTTKQCPELKNKPKIFIFQTAKRTETDTVTVLPHGKTAYDTPAESDLLIIYDRYHEDRVDLLKQLHTYIEKYGDQEDLITLASLSYGFDYQPLIISTMTRKFFVKMHSYRGHHLKYFNNHEIVKNQIVKFKEHFVEKNHEKKDTSIFSSLKKKFSFKKKRDAVNKKEGNGEGSSRSSTQSFREYQKELKETEEEKKREEKNVQDSATKPETTFKSPLPVGKATVVKNRPQKPLSKETEIRRSKRLSTASSNSGDRPAWKP